jgi:peptidoglycan/LPS O-acetylase OafA/YrhL
MKKKSNNNNNIKEQCHPQLMNLEVLDGVRSLTTIGILFVHVQFFFGWLFYHSAIPCYAAVGRSWPLFRSLEKPSFHLNTFWIISGFLCELQLTQLLLSRQHQQHPSSRPPQQQQEARRLLFDLIKFFVNRIARILPLYALIVFLSYQDQHKRFDEWENNAVSLVKCTSMAEAVWPALTFTMHLPRKGTLCAQHGWTLQNDVHGYLFLTLFAAAATAYASTKTAHPKTFRVVVVTWLHDHKTIVFWALYGISVAILVARKPFDWDHLSGEAWIDYQNRAGGGLENLNPDEVQMIDDTGADLANLWPAQPFDEQTRAYTRHRMMNSYFSGLWGHGGSFFLGAALFSNLHANQGKASYLWIKVMMSCFVLYKSNADFVLSGFPVYCILEALLCWNAGSPLAFLRPFLSGKVWQWFAPYTFGVYMVHYIVLSVRSKLFVVSRAAAIRAGQPPCQDYTVAFLLRETFLCFWISLVIAIVLHHTIELPFLVLRKRYLSVSRLVVDESSDTKTKATTND